MKNYLSIIEGGQGKVKPQKDVVIFCTYIDRNGVKAFFCEAQKYTVIFSFFSMILNKYATVTVDTNRRFNKLGKEAIPLEWEKTFYDECYIGPSKYGRCFLSKSFDEAVQKTFYVLHNLLSSSPEIMPDAETALCVQCSLPSLQSKTKEILGITD